nr:hypothetical protein [uncultured Hyphomonas sp.]
MTDNSEARPNFRRLRIIQIASLIVGAGVLILSLWLMGQFRKPEVVPIVMAFAFASISFSGLFYFGALLLEGSLQKYILSDDTVIKGDNVEMVTRTAESGDAEIDKWIGTYAFTRNLFGMSLVPILILIALYFFA